MLDEIKAAKAGDTVWDQGERSSIKGLHARVLSDGKVSFFYYYRTRDNKQRRPKVGTMGEITLQEARARARRLAERVFLGEDPKGEWDDRKAEMTVQELYEKALKDHWETARYTQSGWTRQVKGLFTRNIKPDFGSSRLSELTPGTVRDWHKKYADKPYTGNRALAVLSKMFHYAEEQEIRSQNSNPCHLVKNHPEKKRKRFANHDEIKKVGEILVREEKKSPAGVAFLYLLIFSGSRPRAIERVGWEQLREFEVEGEKYGILTFRGKTTETTGQEETVILPPQAMRALNRLPRIEGETITGIKMPRKLWARIKKEAGCPDLWARDWRRTFATVGLSGGIEIGMIGELLNHRSVQTTKGYAHLDNSSAVGVARSIAGKMENLMNGTAG